MLSQPIYENHSLLQSNESEARQNKTSKLKSFDVLYFDILLHIIDKIELIQLFFVRPIYRDFNYANLLYILFAVR